ncbi:MAG: lipopolysaccharide biosynthesis protein [Flavobacteriales bacterium]
MTDQKKELTSSFSWNTLTVVLQVVIQLAYTGLLARLIAKDSFMLMGIVLGLMGFAEIFSQVGVGPALVQRKEVNQQHINGAFYTALILGAIFTSVFMLLAPWIASFYQLPELGPIIGVVSTSFLISAVAVVPRSMMMKHMRFKTMFKASMVSIVGGNLFVGLTLAYLGWNVWAYVWALFAQNALMTLALWYFQPVRITRKWEWKYTRELVRYGVGSTIFNALNYLATKLDVMLVPRFLRGDAIELSDLSKAQGSYYERASYAMTQPITVMGKLSDSVLFSGMSKMQDDRARLAKLLMLATTMLSIILVPTTIFMLFNSHSLIRIWLGPEYLETATILGVLFIAVIFRSLSKLGDSLLRACDAVYTGAMYKAIYVVCIAIGIFFAVPHGMTMVAWAIVAATGLHYLMNMHLSLQLVQGQWLRLLKALAPGVILGFLAWLSCWLVNLLHWLVPMPDIVHLAAAFMAMLLLIVPAIFLFPSLLGFDDLNLLRHLPQRLASNRWVKLLILRLPK